jgi:hypothetical protein
VRNGRSRPWTRGADVRLASSIPHFAHRITADDGASKIHSDPVFARAAAGHPTTHEARRHKKTEDSARCRQSLLSAPTTGKTIRIFLAEGEPTGILLAEISNWTGKVLVAPRSQLDQLSKREEVRRTGVYLLVGPDPDDPSRALASIGEGDNGG